MPHYLLQVSYTPDAWAALMRQPQDRAETIRPLIERVGGKLDAFYFAFGEHDVVLLAEIPDNVTTAALAIAVASAGAVSAFHTTVLLTSAEAKQAMERASAIPYSVPGTKVPAGVR